MKFEAGAIQKICMCVVLAATVALSVPCRAQNTCPWLNAATASGVLGGQAVEEVSKSGENIETCLFQLQNASSRDSLRISVITAGNAQDAIRELEHYKSHCTSSAVPLKAIGNEAVLCADDKGKFRGEQAIGRVRNSVFTVAIGTDTVRTPAATNHMLAGKAEKVAEQVADAIF